MANERMLVGVELIKDKNELTEQKNRFNTYFKSITRDENVNYRDHLFLIIDLYESVINLFEFINEDFIIDNSLYDEAGSLQSSIRELKVEVDYFFNQDYVKKNIPRESTEDSATLVRIEHILIQLINDWNELRENIAENDIVNELHSFRKEKEKIDEEFNELKNVFEGWKNRDIYEIFKIDSDDFRKIARRYETGFYLVVLFSALYFLGLTIYINNIDLGFIKISFPEKIHGILSPEFYIQKISFLVLSTTLAAFFLKRSFMNRRLADEAFRTAKELDALPRYMEGMSNELKDKIRFDLAYKYFGNGIHHESYTGGENLMHENMKANTDFIKTVKDLKTSDSGKTGSEGK
ncbi:hypothetical protein BFR80_016520 [Acinetobacter pittii]|uniref:hypothetical protein n=1 Tax=Acinetobacter pittii TaxID=48296 RepID=UPI0009BD6D0B|nr:hypothetical protein [Acinetobacter pittii]MCK0925678.1 hypothetical protein [Acinetobacter pittii]